MLKIVTSLPLQFLHFMSCKTILSLTDWKFNDIINSVYRKYPTKRFPCN